MSRALPEPAERPLNFACSNDSCDGVRPVAVSLANSIFEQHGIGVARAYCAYMRSHSRDGIRPSFALTSPSRMKRAQGADRVAAAPGALAPEELREGRVTTGTGGNTPAFPAQWFTAYFALSSVNQRLPPSFSRIILRENLAPAWARQDHPTSPSAWRRSSGGAFASTAARP